MRFAEVHPMPPMRVRLTHSRKAYLKALRRFDAGADDAREMLEGADAIASSFDVPGVGLCHVVCMLPDLDRPAAEDVGLIAHEATHVVQDWLAGIAEGKPSDELQAYAVQAVVTQLASEHFAWKQAQIDKRDGEGR